MKTTITDLTTLMRRKVKPRDIVMACNTSPLRMIDPRASWARYCINEGQSFRVYSLGFQVLDGADGNDWLLRGFDALLAHVGKL